MKGEIGVSRSIIDELESLDTKEIYLNVKVVLLQVSSMNFNLGLSKEFMW